jgi:alpha-mannosidase
VAIDSAGDISSIRDRDEGDREILSAPARLVFQYEQPSEFPSWNMDWKDRQLPPFAVVDGPADIRVVEKGPLRVTVEIHRQKLGSTFIQRVSLVAGSRLVSIHTAIDWLTKNSSLKASFPFTLANPLATYNWGLGTVQRGTNNPRQYEVPSHQWSDLSAPDARYGVSILEDSKFGSDKPSDHEMRLTLLYTPNTEKGGYHYEASQDWGHHDFTYALYPHAGDWRQGGTAEQGERLNQAPKVFTTEKHSGRLGRRFSFLEVSSAQIAVRAVKKAEANTSIIVRLQELWGQDAQGVKIRFAAPLARAWEVDGQERKIGEASFSRDELTVDFSRYSPRSFALEFSPSVQAGTAARSLPLALAYTADVVSLDGEKTGGAMSEDGARYPGEQFPRELESEGIRYQLGEAGNNNVLFADGQSIELPAGEFNRLYVLAAAREDTNAEFLIDGVAQRVEVPQWYGKIGDYDTRIWGPRDTVLSILPGFIKRSNVAWFATHRHLAGGTNDSYTFSYLFSYALALGPQARTLTLPKNNKLGIFALTLAADLAAGVLPAAPLYDDFSGRVVVQPSKE